MHVVRYVNVLDPGINRGPWGDDEIAALNTITHAIGQGMWATIAKVLCMCACMCVC
jgi:hypothetical protein